MGRFLMYATITLLAAFVASSYTLLNHGSEGLSEVRTLTAHDLTSNPRLRDGATIAAEGTLVHNDQLAVYELTDENADYPTSLRGISDDVLAPFVGKRVHLNGTLVLEEGNGTHIDVDAIRLADDATPSPRPTGS